MVYPAPALSVEVRMGIREKVELVSLEMGDLKESIKEYLAEQARQSGGKPHMGDGSEWRNDQWGTPHMVKAGLPQGGTASAIERKILTIREQLNEIRKEICGG